MSLTPEQKQTVASWVAAGDNLSAVQKKLAEQFKVSLTYRDVRFLVDDLNLELKDPAPKVDTSDVSKGAPPKAPEKKGMIDRLKEKVGLAPGAVEEDDLPPEDLPDTAEDFPAPPAGASNVTVDLDRIVRPGFMVSGSVTFSDGVSGKWALDQQGRLMLETPQKGYQPVAADVQAKPKRALAFPSPEVVTKSYAAKPTLAWVRFCQQMPEECAVDISDPATIEFTNETRDTIVRTNREVNHAIKAKTDKAHWGVEDRWDFAEDGYGDCEDYQLVKRKRLVEAGFPRRAMRMTVVIDEEGLGHAVMMVRTDRGDLILDNKRDAVLPWHLTGYTFIKREGDAGTAWASLGGAVASPVATAGR